MTRQEIEKRGEELAEEYANGFLEDSPYTKDDYKRGFDACLNLTWPMVEDALTKFIQMRDGHENYVHKTEAQLMERGAMTLELHRLMKALDVERENNRDLKAEAERLAEALEAHRERLEIFADGTLLRCACGSEFCHQLWLNKGDRVYVVSYALTEKVSAALPNYRSKYPKETE